MKKIEKRLRAFGDVLEPMDIRKLFSISIAATHQLIKSGQIRSFKVKSKRLIPKKCVLDYIRAQYEQTSENEKL